MKKLIMSCVLMFAVAVSAVFSIDIGTALDQAAEQFSASLPSGTTVAIVGIASDTENMSEYLLDELTFRFVQQRRLTVANRANLDAIKQEMNFQMSGEVSDASIQEIGAMAGAEIVVHGSLKEIGSIYFLSLQALNVTTATVEDMYRETVELDAVTAPLVGKTVTSQGSVINISTDYTVGQRIGLGFQNLVFGVGSYRAGHIVDGIALTAAHIGGWALILAGIFTPSQEVVSYHYNGSYYYEDYTYDSTTNVILISTGIGCISAAILYGFIRPIFYHKPGTEVGAFGEPDGLRLAIIPFGDNPVMQVSYRKSL